MQGEYRSDSEEISKKNQHYGEILGIIRETTPDHRSNPGRNPETNIRTEFEKKPCSNPAEISEEFRSGLWKNYG